MRIKSENKTHDHRFLPSMNDSKPVQSVAGEKGFRTGQPWNFCRAESYSWTPLWVVVFLADLSWNCVALILPDERA